MAYMREGFILVRGSGRELIIDELDEDAVEIAKLSLWLRTAQKGRPLTNLADKIKLLFKNK